MDFFTVGLFLSLMICLIGTVWRVAGWFRGRAGDSGPESLRPGRFLSISFSAISSFLFDILLLRRTARTGPMRWLAHSLILFGFMGLLLFHALDGVVTASLFSDYESTLDPWQFLRNLFGALVLFGVVLAAVRRLADTRLRALSRFQDWALLLVVGGIVVSGFFLEASKIMSEAVYDRMIAEYSFPDDAREMEALRSFWAREYGVVFSVPPQDSPEFLNLGKAVDADNCASCHSDTASAFVSRSLASGLFFTARAMNTSRADLVFRHVHLGLCFLGLALLPFGKFFHPVAVSANLLVRQGKHVAERAESSGIGSGVELDACSRCGECSLHCSVAPAFAMLGNADILPSEKLRSLNRHAAVGLTGPELERFAEGSRICTECLRCTDICPSGMDLQSLWMASRKCLTLGRTAGPNAEIRMGHPKGWATAFMEMGESEAERTGGDGLADRAESYWACVQCTTCTSVCPVVAVSSDPTRDLDFTPQQIMNLLRMGLKDQALGVRMVWSCTTCYKCQEHCPQNIPVADVLFELRNVAAARLREQREKREGR